MHRATGLSVIIPIYNVEKYIERCLESVFVSMGALPNIQIILVDDGSLDGSGKFAENFAETRSNFLYVYKENGGLSDARNFGLRYVQYDYVAFIDSDDSIQKPYFQKIIEVLQQHPDMIIFDWMDIEGNRIHQLVKGMDFAEVLWTVQPGAWNKIYKTALFDLVKFPKGRVYEDVATIYKLLYFTKKYTYINEPLYNYRKNRKGSILSAGSTTINDLYIALEDVYSFYEIRGVLNGENRKGLCYQYVKLLGWSNMYRQLLFFKFDFQGFYGKMKKNRGLLYNRFPEWQSNALLKRNAEFFGNRLGSDYINTLDRVGKTPLKTFYTVVFLITKNRKRLFHVNKFLLRKDTPFCSTKRIIEWKRH